MSTIAQIRTAWEENVFESSTIKAITSALYPFDIPNLESAANSGLFYFEAEINFITYVVSRVRTDGITGKIRYDFPVRIRAYRENEPSGANFKSVTDTLEALDTIVRSSLGNTWDSTVDFYNPSAEGIRSPELVFLENRPTWVSEVTYTGVKTISA
jgi:hypothetical protein